MKKIMFICTGNICRSAMAHYYMQKKIIDIGKGDEYLITSSGTYAVLGDKSTQNAIKAMKKYNADLENHRATPIQESDILDMDLIICMTKKHKDDILSMYPNLNNKVYTLKEYIEPNTKYKDIDHPWGLSLNVYENCASEIVKYVDKLIEKF